VKQWGQENDLGVKPTVRHSSEVDRLSSRKEALMAMAIVIDVLERRRCFRILNLPRDVRQQLRRVDILSAGSDRSGT
jgi:hypothetical protein